MSARHLRAGARRLGTEETKGNNKGMTASVEGRTMSKARSNMKIAIGIGFVLAYIGCVFGANWAGQHYGIVNIGFGLTGLAGLYFVGLAFSLRDGVQETLGR